MTDDKLRIGIRCSAFGTRDAYHSSAVTDRLSELCGVYCAISHLSFVICHFIRAPGENDFGNKFLHWAMPNLG